MQTWPVLLICINYNWPKFVYCIVCFRVLKHILFLQIIILPAWVFTFYSIGSHYFCQRQRRWAERQCDVSHSTVIEKRSICHQWNKWVVCEGHLVLQCLIWFYDYHKIRVNDRLHVSQCWISNKCRIVIDDCCCYQFHAIKHKCRIVLDDCCCCLVAGQIQCIAANMYRYQSQYMLIVDAQDLGSPPQKNSVTVTIYMTSVDKPQFVPKLRQVMVPESTTVGGNFLNLTAGGGEYQYNITGRKCNHCVPE